MGVLRSKQICEVALNQFCKSLLQTGGSLDVGANRKSGALSCRRTTAGNEGCGDGRMVCVTSGMSLVDSAIVNSLLSKGYKVRLIVQSQEDVEKVTETMLHESGRGNFSAVVADVMNLDSLCSSFEGCSGVFHTSAFIDPSGVSGYTKYMADNEARAAELVIEACSRTESIRKCVFTSSLLACIWRPRDLNCLELPTIIDERCWSDEALCRDKKLWYALGKTIAERTAWKTACGRKNLKLVTVCPALITGQQNSIAYLKGAQEMLADGLLATTCVDKVAEAHIKLYEEDTSCGRYICYDNQLISGTPEANQLLREFNQTPTSNMDQSAKFELCDRKLSNLLGRSKACSFDTYSFFD